MMANYNERKSFIRDIIADDLLDMAIDWIKSNMNPDEVFDESQLEEWAENNDFVRGEA